jgi:opine dehydrogenase
MTTIAILGGGNGGFAAAAHLQQLGHTPQLYNRSNETIAAIRAAGGVEYSGAAGDGFASIPVITTDLETALDGADFVMISLPAIAFSELATKLAPLLDGSRPILLNPGSTGGALAVRETLRATGCDTVPPIGETNTLTYICRKRSEDHIHLSSLVENVRFAALPAAKRPVFDDVLEDVYPTLTPVPNVLHTALSNVNAVLHPPGLLLSAAWIEHTDGDFRFYYDAGTPAVANVMSDLDEERRAIATAWGLDVDPFPTMFADIGSTSKAAGESGSFLRTLRESEPNKEIKAPSSVDHRFFNEDIPFGLVPMQTLARIADVETPTIDSLITLASSVTQSDYHADGWTRDRLGLSDDMDAIQADL